MATIRKRLLAIVTMNMRTTPRMATTTLMTTTPQMATTTLMTTTPQMATTTRMTATPLMTTTTLMMTTPSTINLTTQLEERGINLKKLNLEGKFGFETVKIPIIQFNESFVM